MPVDWIIVIYYGVGFFSLCIWLFNQLGFVSYQRHQEVALSRLGSESAASDRLGLKFVITMLLTLGVSIIVPDFVLKKEIKSVSNENMLANLSLYNADAYLSYIEELLTSPKSIIVTGNIMYPRFYLNSKGEDFKYYPYKKLDYPRLAFVLIGPMGTRNVILAGDELAGVAIANTSNAVVVGCEGKNDYIDAVLIVPTNPGGEIIFRSPMPAPQCPFPEYLCVNGDCD